VSGAGRILIGTSGWHYRHWVGPFYPKGTRPDAFLRHYAGQFPTTEINNTFYNLPAPDTFAAWRDATPPGFVFACKASRYITHMKKLRDPEAGGRRFFRAIEGLGDKRGPILFQLPPRWHVNLDRLAAFLDALPQDCRAAFEFRDESWFASDVYEALARHDAAFCIYDLAGRCAPMEVTAGFVYLRLHGPRGPYQGSYAEDALKAWAERCVTWRKTGHDVYCYFDNDERGYAVENALRLIDLVGVPSVDRGETARRGQGSSQVA